MRIDAQADASAQRSGKRVDYKPNQARFEMATLRVSVSGAPELAVRVIAAPTSRISPEESSEVLQVVLESSVVVEINIGVENGFARQVRIVVCVRPLQPTALSYRQ